MSSITADIRMRVMTVTIENGRANALNADLAAQLLTAISNASPQDVGAVVIRGAGRFAFCAGSDISELTALHEQGKGPGPLLRKESAAFEAIAALDVPTIAAVRGLCLGGGLELALCCDLIIAGDDASLGVPEVHLGAFPALGGPLRLARRIGVGRTMEMMFDGASIDAETALSWGLVNRVVPAESVMREAESWAMRLAQGPQASYRAMKKGMRAALTLPEPDAVEALLHLAEELGGSGEVDEGLRAFAARETPAFWQSRKG